MSGKASARVRRRSRQREGHPAALPTPADHADDGGHHSPSVDTLAGRARVTGRRRKRIPARLTAGGGRIRTRSGEGSESVGHRLNPGAPSHDTGVTGDTHATGDMEFFFQNSAGGVAPMDGLTGASPENRREREPASGRNPIPLPWRTQRSPPRPCPPSLPPYIQVLKYKTNKTAGHDRVPFISPPMHGSPILSLNVYNPDLVRSAVEPHVFPRVEADSTATPAELRATLVNKDGEQVFNHQLTAANLQSQA